MAAAGARCCTGTSAAAIVALSDICTHAGCYVGYDPSLVELTCPCHGSRFALTGVVTQGPAIAPVRLYMTAIAGDTLTITLA